VRFPPLRDRIHFSMRLATEETGLRQDGAKGLDLLQIYPFTFAFVSALAFLGPMVKMAFLARNPNVLYWIGDWPTYVAYLPLVFILIAYIIHRINRLPSKIASLIGLLGPSIMLFLAGYRVAISAITLSSAFSSTDCITNPPMYKLGLEWKAAAAFKKTCNATKEGGTATIDACEGYTDMLAKNPGWQYLSNLEKTSGCGGWCMPAAPLWSMPGGLQDPCSAAAGEALTSEVLYPAMQVAIYDILVLFLATVGIALITPQISKQGIEW